MMELEFERELLNLLLSLNNLYYGIMWELD